MHVSETAKFTELLQQILFIEQNLVFRTDQIFKDGSQFCQMIRF